MGPMLLLTKGKPTKALCRACRRLYKPSKVDLRVISKMGMCFCDPCLGYRAVAKNTKRGAA